MIIIAAFIIGTYYLYQYWSNFSNDLFTNKYLRSDRPRTETNRANYELAYQKNTNFHTPDKQREEVIGLKKEGCSQDKKLPVQQISNNSKGGLQMPELKKNECLEMIKTPVVIGENVIQRMEVSDLTLAIPAIKVRDINAEVTNLVSDVIDDKVIIQGILHKQIFYVGTDNIVHHQSEDVSFSTFLDIPGAEPGMNVLVEPTIEHIISDLIMDGIVLHQKVILQFFVKVLSFQQLIIEIGSGPLVKVEKVIGENSVQTMLNNNVTLAVPAIKIVDITAEVMDMTVDVIEGKVIIQGIIHKQLFYIGTDDIEHHQAEDIPFGEFIEIPGAEAGMNVQVHPDVEHIKRELSEDGTMVCQEVVLELFGKVTESVQINVVTGNDSLVMLPEVIGENTKQILSETTIDLELNAIKIRDIDAVFQGVNAIVINDKVIVQGIIHKQVFFIGEDNIEYHQEEDVPFSTFVDIGGARPGMNVDVIPEIAFIKPILSPAGDLLTQKIIGDIFVKVTENIQFNVNEVRAQKV